MNKEDPKLGRLMPSDINIPARSDKPPTVLVVDDEVLVRTVIADYLRD